MTDALKTAGVEVHSGYLLAQWNDGEDCEGGEVTSAAFTSSTKPLRLECAVSKHILGHYSIFAVLVVSRWLTKCVCLVLYKIQV